MTSESLSKPWRRTPLIHSAILSKHAGCQVHLKLENLQPSGCFKSRGVGNFILQHTISLSNPADREKLHFYISSGGNAGLGCASAAASLGVPVSIVVPTTTSQYMIEKLNAAGASDVIQVGASWMEADAHLKDVVIPAAKERGEIPTYVPPFDAQEIWDGNATIVEEVLEDLGGAPDAVVCSVGGGGLFSGIMQGLIRAGANTVTKVLAVETEGAASLALSLKEGRIATLPAITSIANALGTRSVARQTFEYAQLENVKSVVLTDRDAMEGCVRFADDERIMVEAACGVNLALCYGGRLKKVLPELTKESKVVIVVCGGSNITAEMLQSYAQELGQ
ncbi:tryptophan synthase beta subunit-like PLP-dependent enzyme [Periconia macrospinosa]|uniref:L-serine ammonia-lyase n=1 Tax=Periconia macrospinosa TaxID=97972 RepID=A0A2V1DUG0_9PLEO|nr:tryptophan synthase beta subunit-like PLP-dependent enzyme [Periconia macrospinosa]